MNSLLFQRFQFTKPLQIEQAKEWDEVVALPDKIIIRVSDLALERDLAEILSRAKLGEKDYLLSSFFFQKDMKESDMKHAQLFVSLCQPLQDAWTYKIMRRYAPDIYQQELKELLEMYILDALLLKLSKKSTQNYRTMLGIYAVLVENPEYNFQLDFQPSSDTASTLQDYIAELTALVREEPDPQLFLRLPVAAQAPFQVQIKTGEDGFRYFEVLGRCSTCGSVNCVCG